MKIFQKIAQWKWRIEDLILVIILLGLIFLSLGCSTTKSNDKYFDGVNSEYAKNIC